MEPDHKGAWVPGCVPGNACHIKHMAVVFHVFIHSSTESASAGPTMYLWLWSAPGIHRWRKQSDFSHHLCSAGAHSPEAPGCYHTQHFIVNDTGKISWSRKCHCSVLAWKIPWTEELGGPKSQTWPSIYTQRHTHPHIYTLGTPGYSTQDSASGICFKVMSV